MYAISDFIEILNYKKVLLSDQNLTFDTLSYDTRKIRFGTNCLFFALQGQQDGHKYIADAYDKGVRNFIISDLNFGTDNFLNTNFIWVENTLRAIQSIAAKHRSEIHIPIIGITGSNGKTIVKDWLTELLNFDKKVYQSPKSFNSQLGVPLSLWDLSNDFDLGLIEAGISKKNEMNYLQQMIRPNWGILTSLGTAHLEGFSSKQEKLQEKWKLFASADKIILPSAQVDDTYLKDTRIVSWGITKSDKLYVESTLQVDGDTILNFKYVETDFQIHIPFTDKASIENALTCILTMLELGYTIAVIKQRIAMLKPLDMRLKMKKGKNNSSIIDDTYSNDLASLNIALDFLNQQNQYENKKIILSDFEGEHWTDKFKVKLTKLLSSVKLNEVILVGRNFKLTEFNYKGNIRHFENVDDLKSNLNSLNFNNSVVLIKGARKYKLEEISRLLTEKSHDTILQINLKSLENNLKQYRSKISDNVKIMAMVKAFSYGSGSFEIANILQFNNVDYLTVAFVDEGSELRRSGVKLPIMVLSPHENTFDDIILYNLEPEIYSLTILKSFISFLEEKNIINYPIHIKIDTGMHRLGFMPEELDNLLLILKENVEIKIMSVFTHLVGAGSDKFFDFTNTQITLYQEMAEKIKNVVGYKFIRHICNTSGIIHHPEAHMDMVRIGIGLYGYDMSPNDLLLEQVGILKTTITQIKNIQKNETIGYDRNGVLIRDSKIATVKIGYADGYDRRFGNGVGEMLINGKLVKTVGNICMDMCMLDITEIEAREGDEVIVFPDLKAASKRIGTIPYELLTNISSRVKRVYYYE